MNAPSCFCITLFKLLLRDSRRPVPVSMIAFQTFSLRVMLLRDFNSFACTLHYVPSAPPLNDRLVKHDPHLCSSLYNIKNHSLRLLIFFFVALLALQMSLYNFIQCEKNFSPRNVISHSFASFQKRAVKADSGLPLIPTLRS